MSIRITVVSALEKIFKNAPLPGGYDRLSLLKDERGGLQFVIVSDRDAAASVAVDSPLPCRLYTVKDVPVGLAVYPDARNCTLLNGGKRSLQLQKDGCLALQLEARGACVLTMKFTVNKKK